MIIRQAKFEDSIAMSNVFAKTWKYAYKNILSIDFLNALSEDKWVNSFDKMLLQQELITYVATIDGKIVGAIILDSQEGRIIALNVLPNYHHLGIGSQLMKKAFSILQAQHRTIYLQVIKKNHSARTFYEKLGFENTGDTRILSIANTEIEEYIYKYNFE